jgi:hypothetical protein
MTPPFAPDTSTAIPIAIKEAYIDMCASMSNRFDQQPRRPTSQKWRRANVHPKQWDPKKPACWRCRQSYAACATCAGPRCATCKPDCAGTPQPITEQHLIEHLGGTACYAALFADAQGMTRLFVADDDHGGIESAQAAVDALYDLGIIAWAIARRSLDADGNDKHNGSRLFWIMDADAPRDVLKRAGIALLAPIGYSTDEVMDNRAELPFGRSRWTPAGDEYGTLVLAGYEPTRILSGAGGMELLAERIGLAANDTAYILSFAPPAPPKPAPVTTTPTPRRADEGSDTNVAEAFNDQYDTIDVLGWAGCQQHPWFHRNYHCVCSAHDNGDKTPSIAVAGDGRVFFNSPRCLYHNGKRPYSAFGLYQHLIHGGDFTAALDGARRLLMLPEWQPDPEWYAKQQAAKTPTLAPAQVAAEEPITVDRILEDIRRRLESGTVRLTRSELATLRAIARLCKQTGACTASWDDLAEMTSYSRPSVRRAGARLAMIGLIAKHANATEQGAWAPNVFQLLAQPEQNDHYPPLVCEAKMAHDHYPNQAENQQNDQSILSTIKEKECIGEIAATTGEPIDFTLFNSPLIIPDILELVEFKRRHPQPARIARYAAIPVEVYAAYVARITDESHMPDMAARRPNRSGRVVLPAAPPVDITPQHEGISKWELLRCERLGIAPPEEAQPEPSPSLIAPVTLDELTPLLDEAAASGDKAALLALMDRLPALDRAEVAWKYRPTLRQVDSRRITV